VDWSLGSALQLTLVAQRWDLVDQERTRAAYRWYLRKPMTFRGILFLVPMIVWVAILAGLGIPDPWFSILFVVGVVPAFVVVEVIPFFQGRTGKNAR
jgi:hypothetical protein